MLAWQLIQHSLVITTYVAVMMVAVEYVNVQSRGWWLNMTMESRIGDTPLYPSGSTS